MTARHWLLVRRALYIAIAALNLLVFFFDGFDPDKLVIAVLFAAVAVHERTVAELARAEERPL